MIIKVRHIRIPLHVFKNEGNTVDELVEIDIRKEMKATQSNELTMAAYTISPTAKRCLWLAIAKLQEQTGGPACPVERDHWIDIRADDFSSLFLGGDVSGNAYRHIKDGCDELLKTLVRVNKPTEKNPDGHIKWQIGSMAEYQEGSGVVRFRFHEKALPYVSRLPPGFTKIYLHGPAKLRSEYAQRLYEMMIQMRGAPGDLKFLELTVDEIRWRFQLGDKYPRFGDLNKWVIQQAVREIEQKSNLTVEVKKIKQGREVKALRFEFMESTQVDLFK